MDASHLIAQMYGIIVVAVGIGAYLEPARYKKIISDYKSNAAMLYLGGAMATAVGYLIVTFGPNVWEFSPEGLITLIGWMALIKGVLLLVKPDTVMNLAGYWTKNLQQMSLLCLVMGGYLLYFGFMS